LLIDGRLINSQTVDRARVCIIGAGPAGLTLGRELGLAGIKVVLIESGGVGTRSDAQELNEGTVLGDPYVGLRETRHRQLGGSINVWNTDVRATLGAKLVPLDPSDFAVRPHHDLPGWPISHADLQPYYRRAHAICGLGRLAYDAESWQTSERRPFDLGGDVLRSKVYQFVSTAHMRRTLFEDPSRANQIRVYANTTVTSLRPGTPTNRVGEANAQTAGGAMLRVAADVFVLAAGAIENARMLLMMLLHSETSGLAGSGHRWIGRCFMEHPRDTAMTLVPRNADVVRRAGFYDAFTASDGTTIIGRVAFGDGPPNGDLPNMSIGLQPVERETGRFRVLWRRVLHERSGTAYGWSQHGDPAGQVDRFRLLVNLEQRPDPSNRVALGSDRDSLGQLRPALHWRWDPSAQAQLESLRKIIAREFENAGLGEVTWQPGQLPDPNAHHHSGTTRMAADAEHGIVDVEARVFGCDNLYVTGASVMPTAGFANPALTIVALAARLAEHLRARL